MAMLAVRQERVRVHVWAGDPISRAGILTQLRTGHGLDVVIDDTIDRDDVGVVVADEVDDAVLRAIRDLRGHGVTRLVLVAATVDERSLLKAVEAGVTGVVRRAQADQSGLAAAVRRAAAGDGTLPPDLLGRLLEQVGRLQRQVLDPRGLTFNGLTERELNVLRLLADGRDTGEVGRQLYLSDRTVKNVLHDVTSRFNLRNRTQAVAYAIRQGLI